MEKANEIITANQLQYTPQLDDKGHTLEQYSYDHFRFVCFFIEVFCFFYIKTVLSIIPIIEIRKSLFFYYLDFYLLLTHQSILYPKSAFFLFIHSSLA
jgi:hypothetical protein